MQLTPKDLHLIGIISEQGYQGTTHWLMFLFEIKLRLTELPPEHEEGSFHWVTVEELQKLPLPGTDREKIWPLFWEHRGGFFVANCQCTKDQPDEWTLLQSNPAQS